MMRTTRRPLAEGESSPAGDRMNAALGAGVLEPAIDAAMAAQARNSIEKMLCHQLAAAHHMAMRLIEHSTNPNLQAADLARFTNASAPPHRPVARLFAALVDVRKPLDGAEFQGARDRTISRLTLARQKVALRRHLGTEN